MRRIFVGIVLLGCWLSPADAGPRRHRQVQTVHTHVESSVIAFMRRHLDGNPTGWARVWCGRMLDIALRATGHAPGSNLARAYARYGRPARGPAPGVIGVQRHHVFVVTKVVGRGRVVAISGNDSRRVRERVRSTAGVIAWRVP